MRSRASYKGHPLHPALIPFPFAFLTGALLFDLLAVVTDTTALAATASHLAAAGVIAALIAAVPGFIDYFFTVPPKSSGKSRATKHMLLNLGGVALIAVSWLVRRPAPDAPGVIVLALEATAVVGLIMAGWMGGTLVNRNLIGVDHRYADAGKWSEASVPRKAPIVVAKKGELEVNQMKLLHVDGRRIVLGRTEDGYVAFDDACTHRGGSLAGGVMMCGTVQCLWHGSQFDVTSGTVRAGPAEKPIQAYRIEEEGDEVRLLL